jgi:hypothetical protein
VGVNANDLNAQLPKAHFYNLFNCSGAKFTVPNFLGGQYVYSSSSGLGAVGSAKTGSMLAFDVYYAILSGILKPEHSDLADNWDLNKGSPDRILRPIPDVTSPVPIFP